MGRSKAQISVSLDGYMAGPNQDKENPLGEGGMGLHEWAFKLSSSPTTRATPSRWRAGR